VGIDSKTEICSFNPNSNDKRKRKRKREITLKLKPKLEPEPEPDQTNLHPETARYGPFGRHCLRCDR